MTVIMKFKFFLVPCIKLVSNNCVTKKEREKKKIFLCFTDTSFGIENLILSCFIKLNRLPGPSTRSPRRRGSRACSSPRRRTGACGSAMNHPPTRPRRLCTPRSRSSTWPGANCLGKCANQQPAYSKSIFHGFLHQKCLSCVTQPLEDFRLQIVTRAWVAGGGKHGAPRHSTVGLRFPSALSQVFPPSSS